MLQCSKILLLIIDVNNLCTTESQVKGQQLSSCMVSPFLCNIHVSLSLKLMNLGMVIKYVHEAASVTSMDRSQTF